jgi:hypothetical protein
LELAKELYYGDYDRNKWWQLTILLLII